MELPVSTYSDGTNPHVTGFPTDDDNGSQRVGGLTSMPVNSALRYHAQQPSMQDLGYVIFFLSILTALASLDQPLDPLVAALPPGPGSLDFSPACFGTFHTDPLRACMHFFRCVLFFFTLNRLCCSVLSLVKCLGWAFLLHIMMPGLCSSILFSFFVSGRLD